MDNNEDEVKVEGEETPVDMPAEEVAGEDMPADMPEEEAQA